MSTPEADERVALVEKASGCTWDPSTPESTPMRTPRKAGGRIDRSWSRTAIFPHERGGSRAWCSECRLTILIGTLWLLLMLALLPLRALRAATSFPNATALTGCPSGLSAASLPRDALAPDEAFLPLAPDGVHPFTACVRPWVANRQALSEQFRPSDCWAMPWLMRLAVGGASSGLFVDAGVNLGLCSLPMLRRGHNVHAFDGNPTSRDVARSAATNGGGRFAFEHVALAAQSREGAVFMRCPHCNTEKGEPMYFVVHPEACAAAAARQPWEAQSEAQREVIARDATATARRVNPACSRGTCEAVGDGNFRCIRARTLDAMLPTERVPVLKLDADHFEHDVLVGARELFMERRVGIAHIEVDTIVMQGLMRATTRLLLDTYGYALFELVPCLGCAPTTHAAAPRGRCLAEYAMPDEKTEGIERDLFTLRHRCSVDPGALPEGPGRTESRVACEAGCVALKWWLRPIAAGVLQRLSRHAQPVRPEWLLAVSPDLVARVTAVAGSRPEGCVL